MSQRDSGSTCSSLFKSTPRRCFRRRSLFWPFRPPRRSTQQRKATEEVPGERKMSMLEKAKQDYASHRGPRCRGPLDSQSEGNRGSSSQCNTLYGCGRHPAGDEVGLQAGSGHRRRPLRFGFKRGFVAPAATWQKAFSQRSISLNRAGIHGKENDRSRASSQSRQCPRRGRER